MSMEKIVVPTDFTKCSTKAIKTAIAIAENRRAHIYLLHVTNLINDKSISASEQALDEADILLMHDEIDNLLKEMKLDGYRRVSKDRVHVMQEHGKYEQIILKMANNLEADLIVMGTHGEETTAEKMFGTASEHIVRFADCSVLTVKPDGYPVFID